MAEPEPERLVCYYNSKCPVCDAGIASQRRRMAEGAVDWRDINDTPEALADRGVDVNDVRRKLYVIDADGQAHVGADAFARLWRATPRQRWLGRLVTLPLIAPLARLAYNGFAAALYAWNRRKGRW